jgi:hypothetical protein
VNRHIPYAAVFRWTSLVGHSVSSHRPDARSLPLPHCISQGKWDAGTPSGRVGRRLPRNTSRIVSALDSSRRGSQRLTRARAFQLVRRPHHSLYQSRVSSPRVLEALKALTRLTTAPPIQTVTLSRVAFETRQHFHLKDCGGEISLGCYRWTNVYLLVSKVAGRVPSCSGGYNHHDVMHRRSLLGLA